MKHNQHGFSALILLLVVITIGTVGFAGWYVANSDQPTGQKATSDNKEKVDEKTIKRAPDNDEIYGDRTDLTKHETERFSFYYPKKWGVNDHVSGNLTEASGVSDDYSQENPQVQVIKSGVNFHVRELKRTEEQTEYQKKDDDKPPYGGRVLSEQTITIDEFDAVKFETIVAEGKRWEKYNTSVKIFPTDSRYILLSFFHTQDQKDKYQDEIQVIIDSFRVKG